MSHIRMKNYGGGNKLDIIKNNALIGDNYKKLIEIVKPSTANTTYSFSGNKIKFYVNSDIVETTNWMGWKERLSSNNYPYIAGKVTHIKIYARVNGYSSSHIFIRVLGEPDSWSYPLSSSWKTYDFDTSIISSGTINNEWFSMELSTIGRNTKTIYAGSYVEFTFENLSFYKKL